MNTTHQTEAVLSMINARAKNEVYRDVMSGMSAEISYDQLDTIGHDCLEWAQRNGIEISTNEADRVTIQSACTKNKPGRPMKSNAIADDQIRVRLTPRQKQQLRDGCAASDTTMSEVVLGALIQAGLVTR